MNQPVIFFEINVCDSDFEVFMVHILHLYYGLIANRHKGCLDKH